MDALNDAQWSGGDQAPSVPLPDGRVLWLYADTIQGSENPDGSRGPDTRMVHNSVVIQDGDCLIPMVGPDHTDLIPPADDGDWYWPAAGIVLGDRLLMFSDRVQRSTTPGGAGYEVVGMEIAMFALPSLEFLGIELTPSSGTHPHAIQWGRAAVEDGEHVYLYGAQHRSTGAAGMAVFVARAPVGSVTEPNTWHYWDGTTWSTSQFEAIPVIDPSPRGWSYQFSVHLIGERYVAVTKVNEYYGDTVSAFVADSPVGPWTEQPLFAAPSDFVTGELLYSATAHPEITLASGALLVTVCRTNIDWREVWADADLYKPDFYEVVLS